MRVDFLEQSFIVLEVASTCMETYDAHEDILVVSQVCHCLEILDVGMLVQYKVYHQREKVYLSIYNDILVHTSGA